MTDVARDTVGALKTSPVLLLILCLNVLMLGALLYVAREQKDERAVLTQHLFANCNGGQP